MNMQIVPWRRSAVHAAAKIEETAPESWSYKDFYLALSLPEARFRMAIDETNRVIGFTAYEVHGDRLELLKLTVDLDYQFSGVGTALLSHVSHEAANRSLFRVNAGTAPGNRHGIEFLRRRGFLTTERDDRFVSLTYDSRWRWPVSDRSSSDVIAAKAEYVRLRRRSAHGT